MIHFGKMNNDDDQSSLPVANRSVTVGTTPTTALSYVGGQSAERYFHVVHSWETEGAARSCRLRWLDSDNESIEEAEEAGFISHGPSADESRLNGSSGSHSRREGSGVESIDQSSEDDHTWIVSDNDDDCNDNDCNDGDDVSDDSDGVEMGDALCHVCNARQINAASVPCGHATFCYACGMRAFLARSAHCPSCREPMAQVMKLRQ